MKTIWTILSVLAVANLLAVAGFTGWLVKSERLDMERLREIRATLAVTIPAEKAAAEAEAKKSEADRLAAEAAKETERIPMTAAQMLATRLEVTQLDEERFKRVAREIEDLRARLAADQARLDRTRVEFDAAKKAFEEEIAREQELRTSEQFQKTLDILKGLKPADAKATLVELLNGAGAGIGDGGGAGVESVAASGVEPINQVVAYLDAVEDRARVKIMAEFVKDQPDLAAQLLERLRTRGLFAAAPESSAQ